MDLLEREQWVQRKTGGGWYLSRDLAELDVMDLYRIIPNRIPLQSVDIAGDEGMHLLREILEKHNDNLNKILSFPVKSLLADNPK